MKIRLLLCTALLLAIFISYAQRPLTIACIGASITEGARLEDPVHHSYPGQLQGLLGKDYRVLNFGVSSATLLRKGDLSYWNTGAYKAALQSQPDIVFIDLGGNDSKLINRIHLNDMERDCRDLIHSFSALPSHPRIILLLPFPSFVKDTSQIWDPVIVSGIIPPIQRVAFEENMEVLDMHSLFVDKEARMPDKIHPDLDGTKIIAERLYAQVVQKTDKDYDLSGHLGLPVKISCFYGYRCASLTLQGRDCKFVSPKQAAPGHPWVWRARFWGVEPQADIALLERGFHIVYCDVVELFGNKEAIDRWDAWYRLLHTAGLASRVALEGMSRGAVYAFNWAAAHPDQVAAVYVDNPVLDLKSWPGGLGKLPAAGKELQQLRSDYGLTSDKALATFKGSPIDKTVAIVQGKYPILILCADADEAVAPEENTLLFEKKIRSLGGDITVIHKPGFRHHPHSLPNPAPIVDFIVGAYQERPAVE